MKRKHTLERPNILLIYTDQQRQDTLKVYGNKYAQTPNIDKLSQNGATFHNYFVSSPLCTPSRISLFTGEYCSSHGVGFNGIPLKEDTLTLPIILKRYGYVTANFGKLHFLPHSFRNHKNVHPSYGFDVLINSDEPGCYDDAFSKWVEITAPEQLNDTRTSLPPKAKGYNKPEYSPQPRESHEPYVFKADDDLSHSSFVADEVSRFLHSSKNSTKPFFCVAGFYAPHTPINPPQSCIDLYNIDDMRLPIKHENEEWSGNLGELSENDWKKAWQYYMALISHVDNCVGEIMTALEESGKLTNTIVIFTSDHGEYMGDHGRIQKGMPAEDCISKVPLIIQYPKRVDSGIEINGLCDTPDILPTILDYCGFQIPDNIQGNSLKTLINNPNDNGKEVVISELFEPFGLKETSIRDHNYRYYCNSYGEEKLFDLQTDKHELIDRSKDNEYKDILSNMRFKSLKKVQSIAYPNLEKIFEY